MFILVNSSDDYGMNHCGNFDTHKEAWEYIASSVNDDYDFDIMSLYPLHDDYDCERYNHNGITVFAGYDWCTCYNRNYGDKWLIIEV